MPEVRFALRTLAKNRGPTLVVLSTLTIAIAAATIIYGAIDAVQHVIPASDTDRLVFVASVDARRGSTHIPASAPDLADWTRQATTFEAVAGFTYASAVLTTGTPQRVPTIVATTNLLSLWGIEPILGRAFGPFDGAAGAPSVALISHAFWQSHLAGRAEAVGTTIVLDGRAHSIVGVLPPELGIGLFRGRSVITPASAVTAQSPRSARNVMAVGKLKPEVTREQASAELNVIARRLQLDYPDTNANITVVVRPLIELLGMEVPFLLGLLGSVAVLVVVVACANVCNVILSRTIAREREFAVRSALGATRRHHIRQLMVEGFLLSACAGVAGLVLASAGIDAVRGMSPNVLGLSGLSLNIRVAAAAAALAFAAPFIFAWLPALRSPLPDPKCLGEGRTSNRPRASRLQQASVVIQVAVALALMLEISVMVRTAWTLHTGNNGFDATQVLMVPLEPPAAGRQDSQASQQFFDQLLGDLDSLPQVTAAATTSHVPLIDDSPGSRFAIEGTVAREGEQPVGNRTLVSADYFQVLRVPVLQGRPFVGSDFGTAPRVALIDQAAARRYWPGRNPIDSRIAFTQDDPQDWLEVVGIVGSVKSYAFDEQMRPRIYLPATTDPVHDRDLLIRSTGVDRAGLIASVRAAVARLDNDLPVAMFALDELLYEELQGVYVIPPVAPRMSTR